MIATVIISSISVKPAWARVRRRLMEVTTRSPDRGGGERGWAEAQPLFVQALEDAAARVLGAGADGVEDLGAGTVEDALAGGPVEGVVAIARHRLAVAPHLRGGVAVDVRHRRGRERRRILARVTGRHLVLEVHVALGRPAHAAEAVVVARIAPDRLLRAGDVLRVRVGRDVQAELREEALLRGADRGE